MSCAASEVAVIRPSSCCGKNPFGNDDEQIDRQGQRREKDRQCRQAASASRGPGRFHRRGAWRRRRARSSRRTCRVWFSPCARKKRDAIIGVRVSDTTIETKIVMVSVTANSRNRRPIMPPISSSGISTATSEMLIDTIGEADFPGALRVAAAVFRPPRYSG